MIIAELDRIMPMKSRCIWRSLTAVGLCFVVGLSLGLCYHRCRQGENSIALGRAQQRLSYSVRNFLTGRSPKAVEHVGYTPPIVVSGGHAISSFPDCLYTTPSSPSFQSPSLIIHKRLYTRLQLPARRYKASWPEHRVPALVCCYVKGPSRFPST